MKVREEKLPAERVIRVHRSFIVQKQKIKNIDEGRIVFGKEYIPISDSYKQELQNYVNEHIIWSEVKYLTFFYLTKWTFLCMHFAWYKFKVYICGVHNTEVVKLPILE